MVLAGLTIGAHAAATFDLMYLPSFMGNSVRRYDPVNRVQLGGFAASGVTSLQNRGSRYGYVNLQAGSYSYDMFSGTNFGYTPIGTIQGMTGSNTAYRMTGNQFITYSLPSGGFVASTSVASAAYQASSILPSSHLAGISKTASTIDISIFTSGGALVGTTGLFAGGTVSYVSSAVSFLDRSGYQTVAFVARVDGGPMRLFRANFSPSGAISYYAYDSLNSMNTSYSVGVAANHAGFYVVGADSVAATSARFIAYDNDGTGFSYDTWTETGLDLRNPLTGAYSVGMVLAPEPGEWVAMSMGVGALFIRRKRKAK